MSSRPIYFFSDAHLGAGSAEAEAIKVAKIAALLDLAAKEHAKCFVLGDLFDFWFEFHRKIPRGYDEILKILHNATERGVELHLIGGNHDWWVGDRFAEATGCEVHHRAFRGTLGGFRVYAGHGDGLAPSDWGYRNLLRPILRNRVNISLFRCLPRFAGQLLANIVSDGSRIYTKRRNLELEAEYLDAARKIAASGIDLVIIGHTHEPARIVDLGDAKYVNIGDFFEQFSFARIADGEIFLSTNQD
ncbi:UDP-2,3-diacylglucosamine diphosphatase [bacterium]|nr:UDP-2,3-diacylglucosamine diphosphatase [bacterium]